MKKTLALLFSLLLLLSLAACGSSSKEYATADCAVEEYAAEEEYRNGDTVGEPGTVTAQSAAGSTNAPAQPAKIIYTANYEIETTEFEKSAEALGTLVDSMGGYFESRSLNNYGSGYRYASYTVRIPAEKYSAFCTVAGEQFHVNHFNENADDISEVYYDTQSRLETAQIKLERLQELLKQAASMEDIITIENAISDVEYTIESLSGTLKHYDAQVDYATVYIGLDEVYQLSDNAAAPLTFWEKLASSLKNGLRSVGSFCEWVVMFIAYAWAYLLAAAAIVVVLVRSRRRRKAKKSKAVQISE